MKILRSFPDDGGPEGRSYVQDDLEYRFGSLGILAPEDWPMPERRVWADRWLNDSQRLRQKDNYTQAKIRCAIQALETLSGSRYSGDRWKEYRERNLGIALTQLKDAEQDDYPEYDRKLSELAGIEGE